MANSVLSTERLYAEPFSKSDLPLLRDLHADPRVNQFLNPACARWDDAMLNDKLLHILRDQDRFGFSKWKLYTHDGQFVGRAGFSKFSPTSEIEIGFCLKVDHWGKGYASEIALGLKEWFFRETYFTHLIGYARADHPASRKIYDKLGMQYRETRVVGSWACDLFQVLSPVFCAQEEKDTAAVSA
ncbi:MAG: GNAT family N-acetyltransferase [Stappiaceae bacterium]